MHSLSILNLNESFKSDKNLLMMNALNVESQMIGQQQHVEQQQQRPEVNNKVTIIARNKNDTFKVNRIASDRQSISSSTNGTKRSLQKQKALDDHELESDVELRSIRFPTQVKALRPITISNHHALNNNNTTTSRKNVNSVTIRLNDMKLLSTSMDSILNGSETVTNNVNTIVNNKYPSITLKPNDNDKDKDDDLNNNNNNKNSKFVDRDVSLDSFHR